MGRKDESFKPIQKLFWTGMALLVMEKGMDFTLEEVMDIFGGLNQLEQVEQEGRNDN